MTKQITFKCVAVISQHSSLTYHITLVKDQSSFYEIRSLAIYIKIKAFHLVKDTHREKAPSNKSAALTKSTNMDIWVISTSNQLFVRGT